MLCNDPAREAEWDAWYDEQHVPDMLSCGAFGAMSRWRRTPRTRVGSNFLTLYDVSTETVDEAVERSAATLAEIVAAGRKHETHTGALTVTLRPTGRHAGAGFRRDASHRVTKSRVSTVQQPAVWRERSLQRRALSPWSGTVPTRR